MTFDDAMRFILSSSNIRFNLPYVEAKQHHHIYIDRLRSFLDILGNPERAIPHYIHVTGTSGKGSTCLFLQHILHASGARVGTTISPHPTHITERWTVGLNDMSQEDFTRIVKEMNPALNEHARTCPHGPPSFFEMTTAIGLYHFSQTTCDWGVIEVGCGGRYDGTNVIPYKDVAIVTNVGLDHTAILGKDKETIAYEKIGIVTPGSQLFTNERDPKIANILSSETKRLGGTYTNTSTLEASITDHSFDGVTFSFEDTSYKLNVLGKHQVDNALLTISAARYVGISEEHIVEGLERTTLPLRMEVVSKEPITILDSAHNEDKILSTVNTLLSLNKDDAPIHLVVGLSSGKHVDAIIRILTRLQPASVACTRNTVNHMRKVIFPAHMCEKFKEYLPGTPIELFLDPMDALSWSQKQAKKCDILLITGSVFLSGELRPTLTI